MEIKPVGQLRTMPIIQRHGNNPILEAKDIPYPSSYVFNSGVVKHRGKYIMIFRNDHFENFSEDNWWSGVTRNFGIAYSDDGVNFIPEAKPIIEFPEGETGYDPRIVILDDVFYIVYTAVTNKGQFARILCSKDLKEFKVVYNGMAETRNAILFPEKINGKYYLLIRPFWEMIDHYNQQTDGWIGQPFNMWITASPDMKYWGDNERLLSIEDVPFANIKVGGGPVPLRTPKGWLIIYHAVDTDPSRGKNGIEKIWKHRYTFSVMLVDINDPTKILGICKEPIMVPETEYETSGGFRNNVLFPTGAILEDDGTVKIYYGAADTSICLATVMLDDLLNLV